MANKKSNRLYSLDPYRAYTVVQASDVLEVNPATILRKIKGGKLHAMKMGKQYLMTGQALLDMVGLVSIEGDILNLEYALINLDLGYEPHPTKLATSPFYNISASALKRIALTARTRGEMLTKIAKFINETRRPHLKSGHANIRR